MTCLVCLSYSIVTPFDCSFDWSIIRRRSQWSLDGPKKTRFLSGGKVCLPSDPSPSPMARSEEKLQVRLTPSVDLPDSACAVRSRKHAFFENREMVNL